MIDLDGIIALLLSMSYSESYLSDKMLLYMFPWKPMNYF